MKSETRLQCEYAVTKFSEHINSKLSDGNLLYVGIAGDPTGGEYSSLFKKFNVKTFDVCKEWNPDIVGDITKTNFEEGTWDVIVCVQTLEHIPNVWDLPKELKRILKKSGYAIVDCPWDYPYHAEPEFGDYWRFSKDGIVEFFKHELKVVGIYEGTKNNSVLLKHYDA